MKKSILFLALLSFALIFITPQVNASDRDIGYSFVLPIDNAAVVAVNQAVMNVSYGYVTTVELRDPGDMRLEHFGYAQCQGLEAKSPVIITALSNGDLTGICSCFRDNYGTRSKDSFTRYINYFRIISTSNGGAGY